jgi:hypothetical protein
MPAEVLVTFSDTISGPDGSLYLARACGREMADGRWEGWIEFEAIDGTAVLRSGRETTQPNRTDAAYWATGLTPVYLEGALDRALNPVAPLPPPVVMTPAFDGPLPSGREDQAGHTDSVLNPFSVYRKGEAVLRRQLSAMAAWHLVNIIADYELSAIPTDALARMPADQLTELIVEAVRQPVAGPQV